MSRYTVATVCSMVLFSIVTSASPARAQGQLAYCKADAKRQCKRQSRAEHQARIGTARPAENHRLQR